VFKNLGWGKMKLLYANIVEYHFTENQYVYKEGDIADRLYIIKEGEFLICRDQVIEIEYLESRDTYHEKSPQ